MFELPEYSQLFNYSSALLQKLVEASNLADKLTEISEEVK